MRQIPFVLLLAALVGSTGCDFFVDGGGDCFDCFSTPSRPLEAVTRAEQPPLPISGGTLLVARDGRTVLASDPDRDVIWVADVDSTTGPAVQVTLEAGDEPGRIAEGPDGAFFVVLRGRGTIVRLDAPGFDVTWQRGACAAPRGVAHDATTGAVYVTCAGGELLTMSSESGDVERRVFLAPDLRDVVPQGDHVWVSRFVSAEVLRVNADGAIVDTHTPVSPLPELRPAVAWRMMRDPTGDGVIVVHQLGATEGRPIQVSQPGGYGGGDFDPCGGSIVQSAVTVIRPDGQNTVRAPGQVLPVDLASTPDGRQLAFVGAGTRNDDFAFRGPVTTVTMTEVLSASEIDCFGATFLDEPAGSEVFRDGRQVVAIAFDGEGRQVTQSRDPWEIRIAGHNTIALPGPSWKDSGHDLFHEDAGGGIACASCHAEGGIDGLVWRFEGIGSRRTQEIRGGIMDTAPFHWDGDMDDFQMLVDEVFMKRMSGPRLDAAHAAALSSWIDQLEPAPRIAGLEGGAVDRGRELFHGDAQCSACHSGPLLSNNRSMRVGTGGRFQTPSLLGVGMRTPLMHDGCAPTLRDRLTDPCAGGDDHGHTSDLDDRQIDDLVAYLRTL